MPLCVMTEGVVHDCGLQKKGHLARDEGGQPFQVCKGWLVASMPLPIMFGHTVPRDDVPSDSNAWSKCGKKMVRLIEAFDLPWNIRGVR
jgi:hypothetical protein